MMKNKNLGDGFLAILFVLLSAIAFVIPTEKTGTFWVAYIFTGIAIAAQIVIWKNAFGKGDTLKSKFLGLPVIYIGIVYLVVQIAAFAVFTAVPALPTWSAIAACTAILGFSAIFMIAGEAGREEIERVEAKVQKKVFFIKELQADVELLMDQEPDAETKAALRQLAETIRFSDPMSDDSLMEIENLILEKLAELKMTSDKMPTIKVVASLLSERNKKCKLRR